MEEQNFKEWADRYFEDASLILTAKSKVTGKVYTEEEMKEMYKKQKEWERSK